MENTAGELYSPLFIQEEQVNKKVRQTKNNLMNNGFLKPMDKTL
jgi:hypothetical protein